jgi:hypothetical protein
MNNKKSRPNLSRLQRLFYVRSFFTPTVGFFLPTVGCEKRPRSISRIVKNDRAAYHVL